MLQAAQVPACFEDFELGDEIGADIGARMIDRIAHAGLRREMDDAVDLGMRPREAEQRLGIGEIEALEAEAALARQGREPRLFQRDRIIVVDVIDADDVFAALQKRRADMHADEAGRAGDENRHRFSITRTLRGNHPFVATRSLARCVSRRMLALNCRARQS